MELFPAVIIHGVADARTVLNRRRPVTLLSAPGAGLYAGCLWWQELLLAADVSGPALLDCADAPGRALEALRLGLAGIVLRADEPLFSRIARIASAQGATLLPTPPPALDMAVRGAEIRLAAWLGG